MQQKAGDDPSSSPQNLAQAAILAALASRWQEAVKLNKKIINLEKDNIEALNRLARAHYFLGEVTRAQKYYRKALELDPYNIIAIKNLEKLAKSTRGANGSPRSPREAGEAGNWHAPVASGKLRAGSALNLSQIFLYEPGKTRLVYLLNLAPPSTLVSLSCGEQVYLNPKNHAITILNSAGVYLGAFPDDLAHRLISLIAQGYKYETYIKCTTTKMLAIFVKEVERSSKFAAQPSFQTKHSLFDEDN